MSKKVKRNHRGYRASGKMRWNRKAKKYLSNEQVSNRILAVIGILTLLLAFVSVRSTMGGNSSSAANAEAYPAPQAEAETTAYANESMASDVNSQTNSNYASSAAANTTSSGGQITDRGFGGHRHDAELGLIYMNGRYYVPSAGRFASADPVVPNPTNPQAWNRYSYVYNNPVTLSDPTGNIPCYMNCPGETYDPVQGQFMANYAGPWDVDQQRANAARAEAVIRGTTETAVGMLWEPADWGIAMSDGFQWYDGVGMLPIIPAAAGRWGDEVGGVVSRYSKGLFDQLGDNLDNFLARARSVNGDKSMADSIWRHFFSYADETESFASNMFVYVGDDGLVRGAMKIAEDGFAAQHGIYVSYIEGLGNGAGTNLLQGAVQESINRGYGGKFYLHPIANRPDLIEWYTKRGGQYIDGAFYWDEEVALALLNQ